MAAAAVLSLERLAGEAIAVYAARILVLVNDAAFQMDDGSTIVHCEYNVPTFGIQSTIAGAAANALDMVALDRNAGEIIGVALGAVGTHTGFCGRIAAAALVATVQDNGTCFGAGVGATQLVPLYDPPTIMILFTVAAPGAGNALEVQGSDNVVDGGDPTPAGWANAFVAAAITQAGKAIYLGG